MYMPATRDLSKQKMTMLMNWLNNPSLDKTPTPLLASAKEVNVIAANETAGDNDLARMTRIKGGIEAMDAQD